MSAPILVFAKRNPEIRADLTPSPGKYRSRQVRLSVDVENPDSGYDSQ